MTQLEKVPMGRMFIDDEMRETTLRILNSGYWIKGPESKAFGKEWAEYCDALGGVPCSNGSVALIAALHALGIGPGDEVIVPSHTSQVQHAYRWLEQPLFSQRSKKSITQ